MIDDKAHIGSSPPRRWSCAVCGRDALRLATFLRAQNLDGIVQLGDEDSESSELSKWTNARDVERCGGADFSSSTHPNRVRSGFASSQGVR